MGQQQSIKKSNYDRINYLISNSKEFRRSMWDLKFTPVCALYWPKLTKNIIGYEWIPFNILRIVIVANEWPVEASENKNLIPGNHYFYVTNRTNKYYYNFDQDRWITEQPPDNFIELVTCFKKLLTDI